MTLTPVEDMAAEFDAEAHGDAPPAWAIGMAMDVACLPPDAVVPVVAKFLAWFGACSRMGAILDILPAIEQAGVSPELVEACRVAIREELDGAGSGTLVARAPALCVPGRAVLDATFDVDPAEERRCLDAWGEHLRACPECTVFAVQVAIPRQREGATGRDAWASP